MNSFEQLCINYANETLQFYSNTVIFQEEQVGSHTHIYTHYTHIHTHTHKHTHPVWTWRQCCERCCHGTRRSICESRSSGSRSPSPTTRPSWTSFLQSLMGYFVSLTTRVASPRYVSSPAPLPVCHPPAAHAPGRCFHDDI